MNIVPLAAYLALAAPAAFAQPPTPALQPPVVQFKVEFATASVDDIDNLGIGMDVIPFTLPPSSLPGAAPAFTPEKMSLAVQSGSSIAPLYQTLTRTRGKLFSLPRVTTPDNVSVAAPVDQPITVFTSQVISGSINNSPPLLKRFFRVRGKLTIIPHILPGNSIALDTQPQVSLTEDSAAAPSALGDGVPFILRTFAIGETMVIRAPLAERNKQSDPQAMLIFLTPTISDKAAKP